MSNRWVTGSIAGIALEDTGGRPVKATLVDAEPLQTPYVGNSLEALDLSVHTQLTDRGYRGVHFGVQVAQLPVSVRDDIVTAIDAAVSIGNIFPVVLADDAGADDISVLCVPDYAALGGKVYRRGEIAAGFIKDLEFRFVTIDHTL